MVDVIDVRSDQKHVIFYLALYLYSDVKFDISVILLDIYTI